MICCTEHQNGLFNIIQVVLLTSPMVSHYTWNEIQSHTYCLHDLTFSYLQYHLVPFSLWPIPCSQTHQVPSCFAAFESLFSSLLFWFLIIQYSAYISDKCSLNSQSKTVTQAFFFMSSYFTSQEDIFAKLLFFLLLVFHLCVHHSLSLSLIFCNYTAWLLTPALSLWEQLTLSVHNS